MITVYRGDTTFVTTLTNMTDVTTSFKNALAYAKSIAADGVDAHVMQADVPNDSVSFASTVSGLPGGDTDYVYRGPTVKCHRVKLIKARR